MLSEKITLTLDFFGNPGARCRGQALAAKVVAISAVTEGIGAAAEEQARQEGKGKTKKHKLGRLYF